MFDELLKTTKEVKSGRIELIEMLRSRTKQLMRKYSNQVDRFNVLTATKGVHTQSRKIGQEIPLTSNYF